MKPGLGHEWREPRRRFHQFHAVLFEFVGDGAEDRVGVLFLEAEQDSHGAQIRPQVEQVFRGHLAGHDALFHAPVGEGGNHLGKLSNLEPGDVVHQSGQSWVGLALHGGGDDALDAGGAGQPCEIEWQRAAAGNQADGFKR